MDVTKLPFNQFIGLKKSPPNSDFLVYLPDGQQYTNHLGTVHASAILAVAEAGSGEFLSRHIASNENIVPVVRRLESKFRKPGIGLLSARATNTHDEIINWNIELKEKSRTSANVNVEVVDSSGVVILTAKIEWFLLRK